MSTSTDHVLSVEKPEPASTHVFDESGAILYSVSTKTNHEDRQHWTTVHDAENKVLATLEWFDILEFYVTYGKDERVDLDKWAHTSILPFVHDVTVKSEDGHAYKWKMHKDAKKMELFDEEEGASKEPVARIVEPANNKRGVNIVIVPSAWEARDIIVISFLFLDKKHRMYDYMFHPMPVGNEMGQVWDHSYNAGDVMKDNYDVTVRH